MSNQEMELVSLNNKFGIDKTVKFAEKAPGLTVIKINNEHAQAEIMLQGAHLIHWQPVDEQPVIWLSEDAKFVAGKSIRGGVPVCWPWFGAHTTNTSFPAHGHARTTMWQPVKIEQLADGSTQLVFKLIESDATKKLWPHDTDVEMIYTIGQILDISLITKNKGNEAIVLSEALHTYFKVGDVSKVSITGLDGCRYLDKTDGFTSKQQSGPVVINSEVDRVYIDTSADVYIDDPILNRRINIIKDGSHSTVVWNPWESVAAAMGDLGENGYLDMLCVESANAVDNVITLEAGETHCLNVKYSVAKIDA